MSKEKTTVVEKNKEYEAEILANGVDGEGIAKVDGYTIFIDGAIKGEKVRFLMLKTNASYGYGKLLEVLVKSHERVEPICKCYTKCGGCTLQHMSYKGQLEFKTDKVKSTITKFLGEEYLKNVQFNEIIGMAEPYSYRDKAQYPVQDGKIGFYKDRTHDVIENDRCLIQDEVADKLAKRAFELLKNAGNTCYDEATQKGNLRHIMIRSGKFSNELMLVIITNENALKDINNIISELTKDFTNLKSVIQNINNQNTNVIMGKKCITLYGSDYIVDSLNNLKFKISPLSFYQVNPVQTLKLYGTAVELAEVSKEDTVFDLYCGIGTIGSFVAQSSKNVFGVEIVPEAIENAKENAKLNNLNNIEFVCGAAEDVIPKYYKNGNKADVVFVDPPRKGCDAKLLNTICEMKPRKLVYISCNVATLARDLQFLTQNGFNLKVVQPVDMFPQTSHVETIALLERS